MKVLVFAASTSRESVNKALVGHAARRLEAEFLEDAEIVTLDLNDFEMPIYSIDREREGGIPDEAQRIPKVKETFDFERGELTDEALSARLGEALGRLSERIQTHRD